MKQIGIFCSASDTIDKIYFEKAAELGTWIGKHHKTLVYGGANVGLMERIAYAVKTAGGNIIGVIPTVLEQNKKVSSLPDRIIKTGNLSERKEIILQQSEVIIALPGGIGTFDEIFHVMSTASLGYHNKKIILYNINGFFNGMLDILQALQEKKFTRHPLNHYFQTANTFDELTDLLNITCNHD